MRILLRNFKTREYYKGPGLWTRFPEEARAFAHSLQAMDFAFDLNLEDLEILMAFEDPRYNISLPVHALTQRAERPPPPPIQL